MSRAALGLAVCMFASAIGGFAPQPAMASISVFIVSGSYGLTGARTPILNRREQPVRVQVTSTSAVQSVQVQVGSVTQELTFLNGSWVGTLSLGGLARGEYVMRAVATNFDAEQAFTEFSLPLDFEPVLTFSSPQAWSVARPRLRLAAQCADDNPLGCSELKAAYQYANQSSPSATTNLASGTNVIDTEVDLSALQGTKGSIVFSARDSVGQTITASVDIAGVIGPEAIELEALEGRVLDLDATRVVVGVQGTIRLYDRQAHDYVTVLADLPVTAAYKFEPFWGIALAADTVLFTHYNPQAFQSPFSALYEWRGEQAVVISQPNSRYSLAAAGHYAIWSEGTRLVRRDLRTGTNAEISVTAGNWKNSVTASGDVWFWRSDYQICRYHEGTTTQITEDDRANVYPLADGEHVVYGKWTRGEVSGGAPYAIAVSGPEGEELLDVGDSNREPSPKTDYDIAGGFVAYTSMWGAARQVFLRHPDGTKERLTQFGTDSRLDALSRTGGVMLLNGGKRYYARPGGTAPIEVSPDFGKAVPVGSEWHWALGRSVFSLLGEGDAGTDGGPTALPDAGTDGRPTTLPDAGSEGEPTDTGATGPSMPETDDGSAPTDELDSDAGIDPPAAQDDGGPDVDVEDGGLGTEQSPVGSKNPHRRDADGCSLSADGRGAGGWTTALMILASALRGLRGRRRRSAPGAGSGAGPERARRHRAQ